MTENQFSDGNSIPASKCNVLTVRRIYLSTGDKCVSYICDFHYGLQVINYLDDFAGCNTPDKASTEYDTLGQVLKECGLEESVEKAIPPSTSMVCFRYTCIS